MSELYAGLNRVLVKVQELPQEDSLIVSSRKPLSYGIIEKVGTIKDSKEIDPNTFNEGDGVYFNSNAGIDVEIPNYGKFRLLGVSDILVGEKQ